MINSIIKELSSKLKKTLDGYKAMSVYDIESAEILFSESLDFTFDVKMISSCNLEVVKLKWDIINKAMNIDDNIGDITINLKKEVHIIDITKNRQFFIFVAVSGEDVDISSVKELVSSYKKRLNDTTNKKAIAF